MDTDVTEMVQRYRLSLRHIWNCFIWIDPEERNWESVYSFRKLKPALFKTLVGDRLGIEANEPFGEGFKVVPISANGPKLQSIQVNIQKPSSPDGGIWMPLAGPFMADDIDFTLVDLFDWSPLGYLDFRYFVVRIDALRQNPEQVGQHALVEVSDVAVGWTKGPVERDAQPVAAS